MEECSRCLICMIIRTDVRLRPRAVSVRVCKDLRRKTVIIPMLSGTLSDVLKPACA